MRVWAVVLAAVLVAGAATGGYLLRPTDEPEVTSYDGPSPIAAVSPSYPVEPLVLEDDPDLPVLRPGVKLHQVRLGDKPFDLKLQVPVDWARTIPAPSEWRWYPPPGDILNTYFLRVRLVGNQYQPVAAMLDARINALDDAESVKDFILENKSTSGFVANYVNEGYRRVAIETYVPQPGSDVAFAWIALVGREGDRAGMEDLIERIGDSARPGPDYRKP